MADAVVGRIKAVITADTAGLNSGLEKGAKKLGDFSKKATQVGRSMTAKVTLPLVGVGVAAVKVASDFEKSMSKITALVGVAADEVAGMEGQVRSMATTFGKSATEAADALFYITSAGLRGATATDTLAASLKASAIGLGDTATIADLATSALNAYGADVLSATEATDVMTAAVREGKLEASELAGSMGRVLPLSSAMGVSFNEVGAAFAALSRTGTNAAEAATQIRGILSSLLRPTKQAEQAMSGLGLSSEGLRKQIREEGLLATLKTLAERFDGNEAAAASVFGNIRALSGVLDLMGANVATTEQIFANMADTTGTVDDAFAVMSETASFKFAQAMAEVKELLLTLGQDLLPTATGAINVMVEAVRSVASFWEGLPDPIKKGAIALGVMAAATGPVILGIGGITAAASTLMAHPLILSGVVLFGAIATAIGFAAARSAELKDRMKDLRAELDGVEGSITATVPRFEELTSSVRNLLPKEDLDELSNSFSGFVGKATLDAAILSADLSDEFLSMGFNMAELREELSDGSDSFTGFAQVIDEAIVAMNNEQQALASNGLAVMDSAESYQFLIRRISSLNGPLSRNQQLLLDSAIADGYKTTTARELASEIGKVEEAYTMLIAETEEEARAAITNADNLAVLNKVLGENSAEVIQNWRATGRAIDKDREFTYVVERASEVLENMEWWLDANQAAYDGLVGAQERSRIAFTNTTWDINSQAAALALAADSAGYDKVAVRDLADELIGLDNLDPQVIVDLGLNVLGGEEILALIDKLIAIQGKDFFASGLPEYGMPSGPLGDLMKLREALEAALESPQSGGGGGGGRLPLPDVTDAEKDLERFVSGVIQSANNLLGRDFAEAMFDGTPEQIRDTFRDLMDDVTEMLKDQTDKSLTAALGDLQAEFARLADLSKLRTELENQLDDINGVVESAKDKFALSLEPDQGINQLPIMAQAQQQLAQARKFVQALRRLKNLGLPASIIEQVVGAGIVDGTMMANQLLSLSPEDIGELVSVTSEMERLRTEAGKLVGDALGKGEVEEQLSSTVDAMQKLTEAIQVDLYSAFATFIQDLGGEIDELKKPPGATAPTPAPAPAPGTPSPSPAPETGSGAGGGSSQYTVKAGDGLWGIAAALLGSGSRWKEIARLNGKNPDTYGTKWGIHPGQVLDIPARAMGGSVSRGKPYLVGELGAELFVPNASGTIVPNGSYGGGTTINVTVNAGIGTDGANVGREIIKVLNEYASTNTGRLAPSLVR